MNPTFRIFVCAALGSAAVEVVKVLTIYESGRRFPAHYKKWGFWVVRVFLMLIGGSLAVIYDVQTDILALHIGATAPTIVDTLAKRLPRNIGHDDD